MILFVSLSLYLDLDPYLLAYIILVNSIVFSNTIFHTFISLQIYWYLQRKWLSIYESLQSLYVVSMSGASSAYELSVLISMENGGPGEQARHILEVFLITVQVLELLLMNWWYKPYQVCYIKEDSAGVFHVMLIFTPKKGSLQSFTASFSIVSHL